MRGRPGRLGLPGCASHGRLITAPSPGEAACLAARRATGCVCVNTCLCGFKDSNLSGARRDALRLPKSAEARLRHSGTPIALVIRDTRLFNLPRGMERVYPAKDCEGSCQVKARRSARRPDESIAAESGRKAQRVVAAR